MTRAILPTNTCFDDGPDYLETLITGNPDEDREVLERYLIVHGIYVVPKLDITGQPATIAHGWVLDTDDMSVIQDGILNGKRITFRLDLEEFYQRYTLIHETRYTVPEWVALNKKHSHYGPFREEYLALCKNKILSAARDR